MFIFRHGEIHGIDPVTAQKLRKQDARELCHPLVRPHTFPEGICFDYAVHLQDPGEKEEFRAPGSVLTRVGVTLAPAYAGTGLNEKTRCFPDFSSRMYFLEEAEAVEETMTEQTEAEE